MNKGKVFPALILSVLLSMSLTGCGKDAALPEVSFLGETNVISREEGSGTRAEFESLIKATSAGSSQIAASTEEMLQFVAAQNNTIGYLAYSTAKETTEVNILEVNGVAANEATIRNGKYPLCREYYAAYSGELSAAENDFLTYILSAGQDIVANYAVPVKDSATFLSDGSKGTIEIAGSSSVAPIITELAQEYKNYNPNVTINVTVTDSTQGLTAAIRGECDIALSSRNLESYEEELLTKKAIAKDAIAVIVNKENPITNLSVKQIQKLYNKDCTSWQDLK